MTGTPPTPPSVPRVDTWRQTTSMSFALSNERKGERFGFVAQLVMTDATTPGAPKAATTAKAAHRLLFILLRSLGDGRISQSEDHGFEGALVRTRVVQVDHLDVRIREARDVGEAVGLELERMGGIWRVVRARLGG